MNLYLLRHGSAGQRKLDPLVDHKRPLDKEGKQQCILLGRALNAMKIQFDSVISSPLKRALQTATLVGTETGYEKKIQLSQAMTPEGTWSDFQGLLDSVMDQEEVLLVGHNPNLPIYLNRLLSPSATSPIARVRKGAIAALTVQRGSVKTAMVTRSPAVASNSIQGNEEIAGKNFAKIIGLLPQSPQFQVRPLFVPGSAVMETFLGVTRVRKRATAVDWF